MSYEYDKRLLRSVGRRGYGGFGEVSVSDLQPWQYILVPRAVLPSSKYKYNGNQLVDPNQFFPKPFFTVPLIEGSYSIEVISAWLRSIGADPLKYMTTFDRGYGEYPAIRGEKTGLCFWPPAVFHSQQHLDAWLAYWKAFRRSVLGRSCASMWEVAGLINTGTPIDNGLARLRRQTIDNWESIIDSSWDQVAQQSGVDRLDYRYDFAIPKLYFADPELQAKVMVLYSLGCAHMAYRVWDLFPETLNLTSDQLSLIGHCRQAPNHPAFPGVADLPYLIDTGPSFADGLLGLLTAGAIGIATGGVVGGALSTATSFAKAAAQGSRGPSFAGVSVPSDPTWTMVTVPLIEFADWPQSPAAPLTPAQRMLQSVFDLTVTTPATQAIPRTLAQRILDSGVDLTITTPMTIKPGTRGYIEVVKAKQQSSLLLPALGIGGALLLMKLLKKKG